MRLGMIKMWMRLFGKYRIWILAVVLLNIIYGLLLWLLDGKAFRYIFPTMILGSCLLYCIIEFVLYKADQKRAKALLEFLENPEISEQERVLSLFPECDRMFLIEVGKQLREKEDRIMQQEENVEEYEAYMESWAHEIKTPLTLMTFLLDNRKDEISPTVYNRLEYARTDIQEDIERLLYYARLKSARNDYFFTELLLGDVCDEVIEEYNILLQEKKIRVTTEFEDLLVLSDKKGVQFLITQAVSNAVKYQKGGETDSFIHFSIHRDVWNPQIRLTVRDNGTGVKSYDLPFLFEKGFTGEVGEQKKNATGMGLYLAKQVADHLKVKISVSEDYKEGFEIVFFFPDALGMEK